MLPVTDSSAERTFSKLGMITKTTKYHDRGKTHFRRQLSGGVIDEFFK